MSPPARSNNLSLLQFRLSSVLSFSVRKAKYPLVLRPDTRHVCPLPATATLSCRPNPNTLRAACAAWRLPCFAGTSRCSLRLWQRCFVMRHIMQSGFASAFPDMALASVLWSLGSPCRLTSDACDVAERGVGHVAVLGLKAFHQLNAHHAHERRSLISTPGFPEREFASVQC